MLKNNYPLCHVYKQQRQATTLHLSFFWECTVVCIQASYWSQIFHAFWVSILCFFSLLAVLKCSPNDLPFSAQYLFVFVTSSFHINDANFKLSWSFMAGAPDRTINDYLSCIKWHLLTVVSCPPASCLKISKNEISQSYGLWWIVCTCHTIVYQQHELAESFWWKG